MILYTARLTCKRAKCHHTVKDQSILGPTDSIRWCLAGVEQCWKSKQSVYAVDEQADAEATYDHAWKVYSDLIRKAEA